jgi:hypothetical protein
MKTAFKFNTLRYAESFAARCHKAHMIIMGDDMRFWVVTLAQGEKLIRAGYEAI